MTHTLKDGKVYTWPTVTLEIPAHSLSPKLYRLLTGLRMPIRYQITYFARECARKTLRIFHRNS